MAYWNVRIGDEFVLGGARWTVAFPRDTTLYASAGGRDEWTRANILRPRRDDCQRFTRRRVHRDGRLLTPRPPANLIDIPHGVIATVAQVPANRDLPKSVPHDADAVHVRLTLARQVEGRGLGATYGWERKDFYFTLPAGSDLPTRKEALDGLVADATGWADLQWAPPGAYEAWATAHGYTPGAEAAMAFGFVHTRSRRLRTLDNQDRFHELVLDTAPLPNNRWGTLLTVAGQLPPMPSSGHSSAASDAGSLAGSHVDANADAGNEL